MNTLLLVILLTMGVTQVVCVATLILCKTSEVPMFLVVFLILCIFNSTLLIIVAYGFAGDFHQESTRSFKCLHKQNRNRVGVVPRREYLYAEKFLAACQAQNFQFGLSNFIEKTTPLVFQLYCMDRIIDLLLVH